VNASLFDWSLGEVDSHKVEQFCDNGCGSRGLGPCLVLGKERPEQGVNHGKQGGGYMSLRISKWWHIM